nr:sialidase [Gemmatimonadota bacterium]
MSWQVISPDLTRNDTTRMGLSGGLTPDNIGVEYSGVVFSVEESPITPGLIWAGTNDGLIHITRDGGATWTDVTDNVPGLITWGSIRNIEASRHAEGTAYFTVDGHQEGNFDPWIYRTRDYGESWDLIVNGIEPSPLSFARSILEDPVRQGLLYAGTENGLYVSFDDGDRWQPLQSNLPHAPVYWMVVQEHFNDLVVGTYGRGFWILDDLTPIQQLTDEVASSEAHLFRPRFAYRFRATVPPYASGQEPVAGENPPYGANIDYFLAEASEDSVSIEILNASGETVRGMKGGMAKGINRVWWDLREDPSEGARLRTTPLHAPWVETDEQGFRTNGGLGHLSVLAPPGQYQVKLSVGDRELTE